MTSPISFDHRAQEARQRQALRRLAEAAQPSPSWWESITPEQAFLAVMAFWVFAGSLALIISWPAP